MFYIFLFNYIFFSILSSLIKEKSIRLIIFILLLLTCVYLPASRDIEIGTDSLMYADYINWNLSIFEYSRYFEVGNAVVYRFLIDFFDINYSGLFFVYAFFTNLFVLLAIFKSSKNIYFSMLCFLCFQGIYFSQFNIMRQMLAFSIFLYALTFIINGQNKKNIYYILCIFAILFHNSAIVTLVFPIIRYLLNKSYFLTFFLVNTIIIIIASSFNYLIDRLAGTSIYLSKYMAYINYYNEKDVGIKLFFTNLILIVFIHIICHKKFMGDKDYRFFIFISCVMLNLQFCVAFLDMSEQVFGRFTVYFFCGVIFILPYGYLALNKLSKPFYYIFLTIFLGLTCYVSLYINGMYGVFPFLLNN